MALIVILTRHWWWVSFACLISLLFSFLFLGLKLLDCVMFLFGVKMKENKRRF